MDELMYLLMMLENNIVISTIIAVEIFPIVFMFIAIINIMVESVIVSYDKMFDRCVESKSFENRVASIIFFFSDMGPNISSFSVIALFITSDENGVILTIIFFFGIIVKEVSRWYKNIFYSEIRRRSS